MYNKNSNNTTAHPYHKRLRDEPDVTAVAGIEDIVASKETIILLEAVIFSVDRFIAAFVNYQFSIQKCTQRIKMNHISLAGDIQRTEVADCPSCPGMLEGMNRDACQQ